jgi:SEC-C motif
VTVPDGDHRRTVTMGPSWRPSGARYAQALRITVCKQKKLNFARTIRPSFHRANMVLHFGMAYTVDPAIFERHCTGTPVAISTEILALAREISPGHQPRFVPIAPDQTAKVSECFFNVQSKIDREGGDIVYGWAIWERPRVFLEAEHHAVWAKGSEWVDLTPNDPWIQSVLFLPDPTRIFDPVSYKRTINVKRPLTPAPAIRDWINAAHELSLYMYSESGGPVLHLDPSRLQHFHEKVRNTQAGVFVWLAENTGRNDPCFCGSGRKFKKCCAKFIQVC